MEIPLTHLSAAFAGLALASFVLWALQLFHCWARDLERQSREMSERHREEMWRMREEHRDMMIEMISRTAGKVNETPLQPLVRTRVDGDEMTVTPACKVCADCLADGIHPGPCECEGG